MPPNQTEEFIPLSEVPELLPFRRRGKRVHISTVWRWASKGVRGQKLKTWRVGGTTCTTDEAILEFISATSGSSRPTRRTRQLGDGW